MRTAYLAIAIVGITLSGSSAWQPEVGTQPTIEVHMRIMKRGGGLAQTGWGNTPAVPGQPITWFAHAGNSSPSELTLCGGGVSEVGPLATLRARNAYVWELRIVPSKHSDALTTFDLDWARYKFNASDKPDARGKSTLTLREGQTHIVDFLRADSNSAACSSDSVVIEVGAGMKEDPLLRDAVLQYDMWLTHDAPDAKRTSRHFSAMGRQGVPVAFAFPPLRLAVPELVPNQLRYDVVTAVLGSLRGRITTTGRIAVEVDTTRRVGMAPRGGPLPGYSGGSGAKLLDVGEGEAIAIEVPAPNGVSIRPAVGGVPLPSRNRTQQRPKQRVAIQDGRVMVDEALFFEGHRTSLVLQVKRVG